LTGPRKDTFLGFDFGSRSIGIATGGLASGLASPLLAARVFRSGPDWQAIDAAVAEWQPDGFVVGLAFNTRGEDTVMSRRARRFGGQLRKRYQRPVHYFDETLSTEAARQALRYSTTNGKPTKPCIDKAAAALILESFLHAQQ